MKAAVIVIGNEILTGKFPDANGPFFIRRLRELGVRLVRLAVIDDDVEQIAEEVRRCCAVADVVFTTGGVGPTHDDLTFAGVARAFAVPLEERGELVDILRQAGLPVDDANLRMCQLPRGAELLDDPQIRFPTVRMERVYVLPGIPKLVVRKFEALASLLDGEPVHTARLYSDEHEPLIAARLTAIAGRHPQVDIGSYPRTASEPYAVMLTLESVDAAALAACVAEITAHDLARPAAPPA